MKRKVTLLTKLKRKGIFSKIIIVYCILQINVYVIAALYILYKTGYQVPDEMTKWYFIFFTTELLSLAGVKVAKQKWSLLGSSDESIKDDKEENESDL